MASLKAGLDTGPTSASQEQPTIVQDGPTVSATSQRPQRPKRPNYAKIHAKPLPLEIYPVPSFIPHNPLSLLHVAFTLVSHFLSPPSSHQGAPCLGVFLERSRSVLVTDPASIRILWESGFFGKGSLSRSEPNWLAQERKRRGLDGGLTSEEITQQRRKERQDMKRERARVEREAIELQLQSETVSGAGSTQATRSSTKAADALTSHDTLPNHSISETTIVAAEPKAGDGVTIEGLGETSIAREQTGHERRSSAQSHESEKLVLENQEHLQLSLEEAFFLVYALGILKLNYSGTSIKTSTLSAGELLQAFRRHSYFPPKNLCSLTTDDPFLVNYVVYHHFRSLGWVVRPGNKFSVDYLLYQGGPVFSHAEFAVLIVPSYADARWFETPGQVEMIEKKRQQWHWWWVQNVNRIQTQVVKTLVLTYVDVPHPSRIEISEKNGDVGGVLAQYKVREFIVKRWTPNRSRD